MIQDEKNEIQSEQPEVQNKTFANINGSFKLDVYDWLHDIPQIQNNKKLVEVRFKSTRKDIFENVNNLSLQYGDIVAVESTSGHDVGIVSMAGELVHEQVKKNKMQIPADGFKKIYRKAKQSDIEKWNEAKALEHSTMIKARQLSKRLNLNMKIGDVEYQGDKTKAIFYYIADERVDFRELIKVLAEEFKVRVEMRQIGARQEAGRIGGIGPCGKALCCSSFIGRFASVGTQAARYQELSLNPQKLAGQCGKLKCCLNFEVDSYIDAQKDFPETSLPLIYGGGLKAYYQKTDVYKRTMWYICENTNNINTFVALSVEKVKEIQMLNKQGKEPEKLESDTIIIEDADEPDYENVVGQESLTRFDDKNRRHKSKKHKPGNNQNQQQNNNQQGSKPQNNNPNREQHNRNQANPNNQNQGQKTQERRPPQHHHNPNKPRNNQNEGDAKNNNNAGGGQQPNRNHHREKNRYINRPNQNNNNKGTDTVQS